MKVTVDGAGLAAVAFGATYTPAFYRELTAALRSALSGDRRPLLRLVAEATGGGTDAGPVKDYSEGLDAAVACHDYPQLYDMTAPPAVRQQQYAAALDARSARTRAPTGRSRSTSTPPPTGRRWTGARSGRRRRRQPGRPAGPPGGPLPRRAGPRAQRRARLDHHPGRGRAGRRAVPERAAGRSSPTASTSPRSATPTSCAVADRPHLRRRSPTAGCRSAAPTPGRAGAGDGPVPAPAAARPRRRGRGRPGGRATVADLQDRWWNNYSGHGVGLRGGTWRYTGDDVVRFRLPGPTGRRPAGLRHRVVGPACRDHDRLARRADRPPRTAHWDTRDRRLPGRPSDWPTSPPPVRVVMPAP